MYSDVWLAKNFRTSSVRWCQWNKISDQWRVQAYFSHRSRHRLDTTCSIARCQTPTYLWNDCDENLGIVWKQVMSTLSRNLPDCQKRTQRQIEIKCGCDFRFTFQIVRRFKQTQTISGQWIWQIQMEMRWNMSFCFGYIHILKTPPTPSPLHLIHKLHRVNVP